MISACLVLWLTVPHYAMRPDDLILPERGVRVVKKLKGGKKYVQPTKRRTQRRRV